MSFHRLSQAEIDMLLGVSSAAPEEESLSQAELDTVGEIGTTAMSAAATSLGSLLMQNVSLTNPRVSVASLEQYCQETPAVTYIASLKFQEGFNGDIFLVFQDLDAKIIADLLFGNDASNLPEQLGEMELSALSEATNQLAGNMMTSLSALFKKKMISEPLLINRYDLSQLETPIGITLDDAVVKAIFRFEIGELNDSLFTMLIPVPLAKDMVHAFEAATMPMPAPTPSATRPVETSQPVRDTGASSAPAMPSAMPPAYQAPPQTPAYPMSGIPMPDFNSGQHLNMNSTQAVNAQPVQFQAFDQPAAHLPTGNLNLILDVPLQVTVELGRTKRQVKEVLELGAGSIIELDKLTGDPVDILINGKPIAEGEVVIIDENFAVRITKIKNMADRLGMLQ